MTQGRCSQHDVAQDSSLVADIRSTVGAAAFRMWFSGVSIRQAEETLEIEAHSRFEADWITRRFGSTLDELAARHGHDAVRIQVTESATPHPLPTGEDREGQPGSPPTPRPRRRLLDLDDMIVGPSNQLAWTAARSIAFDADAAHLSPLVVHGTCGVGKTHLLQGACRRFAQTHSGASMRYMTGEDFTNQYIQAVRHNQLDRFRGTIRKLDLLAIDDVHFVAGKARTQEEIIHTIDAMAITGGRIMLASDAHPTSVRRFSKGLTSRCTSGLLVQVEQPDEALRASIAMTLASRRGASMTASAAAQVAAICHTGPRDIQGLLTRILAVRQVAGRSEGPITDQDVRHASDIDRPRRHAPMTVGSLAEAACEVLSISMADLKGRGRASRVVLARGLVSVLARDLTTASYPEIAEALGRRTHSSVHAAVHRLRPQIASNAAIEFAGALTPVSVLRDRIRDAAMTLPRPARG